MKTTTVCIIICLLWSAVVGLQVRISILYTNLTIVQTIFVGDFIYPPSEVLTVQATQNIGTLYDGYYQSNYLGPSMANGRGLQMKYVDRAARIYSGTLLFKNNDGSYRGVDLPFNCTTSFGSSTYNGEIFSCGNTIFNVGADGAIENVQELSSSLQVYVIYFVNSSVFMQALLSSCDLWSNLPTNGASWEKVSSAYCQTSGFYSPLVNPIYSALPNFDGQSAVLFERTDLSWNNVGTVSALNLSTSGLPYPIIWDGNDTIISGWKAGDVGVKTIKGEIKIFRKIDGSWTLSKIITSADLGLTAPGGLGVRLLYLDSKTVLVHAVEGYNRTRVLTGGASFALEKINDDWVITTKFVQQNSQDAYLVGAMSYDTSDKRLFFSACRTFFNGRLSGRECGIKYAVWNRS